MPDADSNAPSNLFVATRVAPEPPLSLMSALPWAYNATFWNHAEPRLEPSCWFWKSCQQQVWEPCGTKRNQGWNQAAGSGNLEISRFGKHAEPSGTKAGTKLFSLEVPQIYIAALTPIIILLKARAPGTRQPQQRFVRLLEF